jgi:hypothetical protein
MGEMLDLIACLVQGFACLGAQPWDVLDLAVNEQLDQPPDVRQQNDHEKLGLLGKHRPRSKIFGFNALVSREEPLGALLLARIVLESALGIGPLFDVRVESTPRFRRNTGLPRARRVSRRGLSKLDKAVLLVPILHPTYAKALITIGSHGTIRMANLVSELKAYENAVRGVVRRLLEAGMILEKPHRGRFVIERSFELDHRHACFPELRDLLRAACKAVGLPFLEPPRVSLSRMKRATWPPDHRGRAALALALSHNGSSDVGMLAKACCAKRRQIVDRARILEEAGYIRTYPVGRSLWIRIDDDALVLKESKALLRGLWRNGLRPSRLRIMSSATD